MSRNKMSYRRRLTKDRELCEAMGNMDDIIAIIDQKIEDYKAYQRAYYKQKNEKKEKNDA